MVNAKNTYLPKAIPIRCFVSHHPVSCDGGLVGRAKKNLNTRNESMSNSSVESLECLFARLAFHSSSEPLPESKRNAVAFKDLTGEIVVDVDKLTVEELKEKFKDIGSFRKL